MIYTKNVVTTLSRECTTINSTFRRLKLPDGITCWQCILQWTYVTGNSWGAGPQMADMWTDDCLTTSGKKGCGDQETFRGCADICIGAG